MAVTPASTPMNPLDIASHGPVIPVIVIDRVEDALPLAEALLAGGVKVLEVTLRTAAGLPAIESIARHLPEGALAATRTRIDDWLESAEARRHPWLGNVRELQNALRNLLLGLDAGLAGTPAAIASAPTGELPRPIADCTATLNDVEEWYLARVLAHTKDNYAHASRILGVDRTTVRRRARGVKA